MLTFTQKPILLIFVCLLIIGSPMTYSQSQSGSENAKQQVRKTKKVPAMRNRVYAQLARAQKLSDEGDKKAGFAVLADVEEKLDSMNSYERAMLWNFYGFMYYADNDIKNTQKYFEKLLAEKNIPDSLELSTLYSLAQLSMQQQNYSKALTYLNQWKNLNTKDITAQQWVLFAQVYFQDKQYQQSINYIDKALQLVAKKKETPKENWLILQRAAYYELKQPKQVTRVLEQMVRLYNKPQYWIQLSSMYGEIGEEKKQLAVMEAAWQAGFVTKQTDLIMLAQLYLYHNVPYKAAKVLKQGMDEGTIVTDTKYLALLAQSYVSAKNDELALPVLQKASKIADDGKFDAQLAHAYFNLEQWQKAIASADKAIERGGVESIGTLHLLKGMSYFNVQQFEQSIDELKQAMTDKSSKKMAKQWLVYVTKEKENQQRLARLQS